MRRASPKRLYDPALFLRPSRTFGRDRRTFCFDLLGSAGKDTGRFVKFLSFFRASCLILLGNSNKICKSLRKTKAHTVAHHLTLDKYGKKHYSSPGGLNGGSLPSRPPKTVNTEFWHEQRRLRYAQERYSNAHYIPAKSLRNRQRGQMRI